MSLIRRLATVSMSTTMILGLSSGVVAADNQASSADGLASTITRVAPASREGVRIKAMFNSDRSFSARGSSSQIAIPASSRGKVVLTSNASGRSIGVSLPGGPAGDGELASDGTVVYGAHETGTKTAVQSFTDSVRLLSVLTSRPVGDQVSYLFDLPKGAHLTMQADGSVMILSEGHRFWWGLPRAPEAPTKRESLPWCVG